MKSWKKALTLFLVLTMMVGVFAFGASAAEADPATYTIRLVDNVESYKPGVFNSVMELSGLTMGNPVKLPKVDFALDGYHLVGWNVEPVADGAYRFDVRESRAWEECEDFDTETNVMTLYAVWVKDTETPEEPEVPEKPDCPNWPDWPNWWPDWPFWPDCDEYFYVYIDYNRDRADDIDRVKLQKGTGIVLEEPTRKGYEFVGWFIGNKEYKGTPLYKSCTITAEWKKTSCADIWGHKHKIVYTDGVRDEVVFKDVVKYVCHLDKTPTIKDPTREGYRFAGWSPAVSTYATECQTYVAQWLPARMPVLITSDHVAYLKGYGAGQIQPEGNITRAEVATILYRLLDSTSVKYYYTSANSFTDVNKGDWYNDAVSTLANAGVINGYGGGKFNPNAPITRAELVAMLARFSTETYSGKCRFVDVAANHWAYDEIALAQYLGWVKGYGAGYFYPEENITRAEVAAILNRMLDRDDCVLIDTKHYVDNPVNAWYYEDILEASIAH